jgi:hypothetical protein
MCRIYIASFPKADYSSFHGRLNFILYRSGYIGELAKISFLSEFSGLTKRTVKKWLIGQSSPKNGLMIFNLMEFIDYKECVLWLVKGKVDLAIGMLDPWQKDHMRNLEKMPAWQQNKMLRLSIRLLNKDKKVTRLIAQRDRGLLSNDHFLSLM